MKINLRFNVENYIKPDSLLFPIDFNQVFPILFIWWHVNIARRFDRLLSVLKARVGMNRKYGDKIAFLVHILGLGIYYFVIGVFTLLTSVSRLALCNSRCPKCDCHYIPPIPVTLSQLVKGVVPLVRPRPSSLFMKTEQRSGNTLMVCPIHLPAAGGWKWAHRQY